MVQAVTLSAALPAPDHYAAAWSFWGGNYGCGGDMNCLNCTSAQAQIKCGSSPILLDTYRTNVSCERTRTDGPPVSFVGDWSCCEELLGPTKFNVTNCFYCPGDADCVKSDAAPLGARDCPLARRDSDWEVFAFVLQNNWTSLDWSVVTTVAWFGGGDPAAQDICLAHSHGARVVLHSDLSAISGSISNATARAAAVQNQLAHAQQLQVDGLNLDIEGYSGDRAALTAYVQELSSALKAGLPHAHISFDLAVHPNGQTGNYDHAALAGVLDYIIPMAYDEDWGSLTPQATSPLPALAASIKEYAGLGVRPEKLLYALPWYGGVWPCDERAPGHPCATSLHGKDWIDMIGRRAADWVWAHVGVDNTSAVRLDAATTTKTFEFVTGDTRYVTYIDDGQTLAAKVQAVRAAGPGVRGAAMWYAEDVDTMPNQQRTAMWQAFYPTAKPEVPFGTTQ